MTVRLFLGLTIASLAFLNPPRGAAQDWGRSVVGIRLEADANLRIEDFSEPIVQKVGEPLDRQKISSSLKNLYATGRFKELRADAAPKEAGVEVIFVASAQYFVGIVSVQGAPRTFNPGSLASATRLRLGQPVADPELAKAQQHLTTTLAEEGYYEAKITDAIKPDLKSQEANIEFSLVPGQASVLSAIEFQGHPVIPSERLIQVARWHTGKRLTSARLERGLLRLHDFYLKQGRLEAYANVQNRIYDHHHHSEKLVLLVEAGPLVKIHIIGARVSSSNMRQLLPMYSQGITDEFAVQQGQRNLEDFFKRRGNYSAQITSDRKVVNSNQEIDITYNVTLGPSGEFDGFAYHGNKVIPDTDLDVYVTIQSKDLPFVWHGNFTQALLVHDVKALTLYYQSQGFAEVKITPRLNDHFENRPNHVFVTFEIVEGPQTRVGHLEIPGIDPELQKTISTFVTTKPGQPFSSIRAKKDRESILEYLGDHGYSHATINWKASPASPTHEVDLEFDIQSGPQERIKRVVLMGNEHTRPGIIQRDILFKAGEPLAQSAIYESQRKLYDLGVFNQVQIAPQDPQSPETQKTVLVKVEESRRWTVGYGGGFEYQRLGSNPAKGQATLSPRLSLDLTRLNVGGRAQTFTIRGHLSNLDTSAGASYLIPHLPARRDLSLRFNGVFDHSRDVQTFSAERSEASVAVEKRYSPSTLLVTRYTYRHVLVDASTLRISADKIPLFSRPARIGLVGASFINDHRDNPADAKHGSYSLADAGLSTQKLGSEADFLRFSGENSTYYAIGKHITFARNTRIGIESPFGGLRQVAIPATKTLPRQVIFTHEIPLPERFFMGGSESHRGFSLNQAGPLDSLHGFPIGGNALFLNTLELRVRVEENRLGFVLFHDAGNVYSTVRRMRLFKFSQSSPSDFDYTSHALGVGVRYMTPVGPIRFDIGYNLNPPRFQTPGAKGATQLPHFQFFLGVGQTF